MEGEEGLLKRRRLQRACDFCRRKKSASISTVLPPPLNDSYVQFDVTMKRIMLTALADSCLGDGRQTSSEGNSKCSNCKLYNESSCTYVEVSWVCPVIIVVSQY